MSTEQTTHPSAPGTTGASGERADEPSCSCWSRRESLMAAGVVVAGSAGLTACGSSSGDAVASAAGSVASGAASVAGGAIAKADIPVGGGKVFEALKVVVTQPTAGDYKAFSATCTHQGCTLANVASGTINCGCHGSQFSITDGSNVAGPNGSPAGSVAALPKVAVEVKGANVIPG
jgi:nitrite reductase/ring-hydroxylating ferredoxin subunit